MIGRRSIDRILIVGLIGIGGWLLLFGWLFSVQIVSGKDYSDRAKNQQRKRIPLVAPRGIIMDRNGIPLVKNTAALSFWTEKKSIKNIQQVDSAFNAILGSNKGYIQRRIAGTRGNWIYLARKVELAKASKLKFLEKDSVFSEEDFCRFYPYGVTAGQIIGYSDVESKGLEGIELKYDERLAGNNGEVIVLSDARGRSSRAFQYGGRPAIPGNNIELTIDLELQKIVEAELSAGIEALGAKNGIAVFLKPSTGEILAMASYPSFNPNEPAATEPEHRKLKAITDIYEPGSTFKIVAFTALLQNHAISLEETVFCENGSWRFAGDTINDAHPYGFLSARKVLIHSSNIGTIKLSMKLPKEVLFNYARSFGFGYLTGIDLPGEVKGMLPKPHAWSKMTYAAFPMGHEVAVTALQMASAYGAIANNGVLVQPFLRKRIFDNAGNVIDTGKVHIVRKVMEPTIADTLCELLQAVVDSGTGVRAKIEGITVAGKTGTSHKVKQNGGGYIKDQYVSSFVGFAPAKSAQIVGVVVVDDPKKGLHFGGWTAAPIWKAIVSRAFAQGLIDANPVEKDSVRTVIRRELVAVPDVRRMSSSQAIELLKNRKLDTEVVGTGLVETQSPQPGRMVSPGTTILLSLKPVENESGKKAIVPNVIGMTLREAVVEFAQSNIKFNVVGSGVVKKQDPAPGTTIDRKGICLLTCDMTPSR